MYEAEICVILLLLRCPFSCDSHQKGHRLKKKSVHVQCISPLLSIATVFVLQLEGSRTIRDTLKRLLKEEGIRGLKKGLSARIISVAPTSAILVTSYEWVKRMSLRVPSQSATPILE